MVNKTIVEGELSVLVEEDEEEGVSICAEVNGINIWDWIRENEKYNVRITLEKLDE
jgi:hypothetical protein